MVTMLLALSACKNEAADPRTETPLVRTMSVPEATSGHQAFTGLVSARVQSNLGFRVRWSVGSGIGKFSLAAFFAE